MPTRSVLLLFLDGVGLGDEADHNPMVQARLPTIRTLLDGAAPVRRSAPWHARDASLVGLDACLGIAGLPQSGTGQATLLTGTNAAALHGAHFGPWVPHRLRPLVRERSVLRRAAAAGLRIAFANAYPEELFAPDTGAVAASPASPADEPAGATVLEREVARRARRTPSYLNAGPPLAALGAGVLTRHTAALQSGAAVASEIVNTGWRERLGRTTLPEPTAEQAGRNLARIAAAHDLTLFAHYSTDNAGHDGDMADAVAALERVDAFLAGVLAAAGADLLLFVVSDHGNIEDVRCGHTRNAALALLVGSGHAQAAAPLRNLQDVCAGVLTPLRAY